MRKCLLFLMFGIIAVMLTGCGATYTRTGDQRSTRIKRDMAKEWKLAAEDWDRFWLVDYVSRLTPNNM